ncbi:MULTISPECIES: hypothetical protein [Emticicia]|uniref:hypothetical protein n=1 Tax=Emticicia TaxID=312278 RepID=UPI00209CB21F|nr:MULTISPECIES: hypothetical protein [Emticicia]UTA67970.1 hypothetical protein MB380_20590 [Emticicia sp. 21SJ11W-3]
MKTKLFLIFVTVACFLLGACQKKQYASFQQGQVETFTHSRTLVSPPKSTTQENKAFETNLATGEIITSNVDNPAEAFEASTNIASPGLIKTEPVEELTYNQKAIDTEFEKLNKFEEYLNANNGKTPEELKESALANEIKLDANINNTFKGGELPGGVPAFWWGCVFTVVGVLLVYIISDNDKEQTKKAINGCLVAAGVVALYYLIALLVGFSTLF